MSIWSQSSLKLKLVCDIGSASVALGLVLFDEGKKPQILYTTRVPISIQENPDPANLENSMIRFLEEAMNTLHKEATAKSEYKTLSNKRIESVYAIYSSPWYVSKSQTILIQKEKRFLLDKNTVEKIIDDEEKKFEEAALSGEYDSILHSDIKMIERELVRVKLNGYETSSPFMKQVTNCELTLYMSLVPHKVLLVLEEFAQKYFHTKKVISHTFPLVSFGAVRDLFPHESDFILLDIAGEMTDVSIVRSSVIGSSSNFALGRNSLVRSVIKKFNVLPEIALSYLDMKKNAGLEETLDKELTAVVEIYIQEWKQNFYKSIEKIRDKKPVPLKIFVTADTDVSTFFVSKLKENSEGTASFSLIELSPALFAEKLDYGKFVVPDPFIALESLFISKHGKEI